MKNELTEHEKVLLELIIGGKKTSQDLQNALHLSGAGLRGVIRSLRGKGFPICSTPHNGGYWLGTGDDVVRTIRQLQSRAISLFETANVLTNYIDHCPIAESPFHEVCDSCYKREVCERVKI